MSKVLLAVNTLQAVGSQPYASHLSLTFRIGRDTTDDFILYNGNRCSIDKFRNQAGRFALQLSCDYLLFLDDDVLIPPNTYQRLKELDKDVVTPFVYIRGYPFEPMFFMSDSGPEGVINLVKHTKWKEQVEELGSPIIPVSAIGFSCCLIKVDLLRRMELKENEPWFLTGLNHTEDVYFCMLARTKLGDEVSIFVDTSLVAAHMLDPEFVSVDNRDALQRFYEELNPTLKEMVHGTTRECSNAEGSTSPSITKRTERANSRRKNNRKRSSHSRPKMGIAEDCR